MALENLFTSGNFSHIDTAFVARFPKVTRLSEIAFCTYKHADYCLDYPHQSTPEGRQVLRDTQELRAITQIATIPWRPPEVYVPRYVYVPQYMCEFLLLFQNATFLSDSDNSGVIEATDNY